MTFGLIVSASATERDAFLIVAEIGFSGFAGGLGVATGLATCRRERSEGVDEWEVGRTGAVLAVGAGSPPLDGKKEKGVAQPDTALDSASVKTTKVEQPGVATGEAPYLGFGVKFRI
jgi:hypothetical protein